MFVFFFFELRTCAAPQFQRASVCFWSKCCRLPQRALPLRVPWALCSRELPSESGEPGLAAGEHSCLRLPWVRDLPPGAQTRHRGIGGSGKEGGAAARGGREVARGSGTARARAQDVGRWRAVSRVSYASRPPPWPLVAPRSLVLTACGVQRA